MNELIDSRNIEVVAGTSIGSVFGLFYILGVKWDYLLDFIMTLNFKDLMDIDMDNILVNQSILTGVKYLGIVREIMSTKIDPDITFAELYKYSKVKYTVNALNISTSANKYFNYLLTPDIKILDAIMASSSLPFIFPPFKINGEYYYDGGMCNNCPTDQVDELCSIAFDLGSFGSDNNGSFKLLDLILSLSSMTNSSFIQKKDIQYQILDHRFKNETINLNQSRDDIFNIYMNGYINSKDIIFNNFIALPGIHGMPLPGTQE